MKNEQEVSTIRLLGVFMLARLTASTAFRMVYPFLPALARGLGVPVEAVAAAISARAALGFFGPAFGAAADLRGRKQALVVALVVFGISLGVIGFWPTYAVFFLGLLVSGGAAVLIDASIHAYIGDTIPYAQRGRAAAVVEFGWSLAYVVGIPLVGWSMGRSGWNTPFLWLGLAGLAVGGLAHWLVPALPVSSQGMKELTAGLRTIWRPAPLMGLLVALLVVLANQVISIVFGIWMEASFGLQLEQLGAASIVIGLAGVAGVTAAIVFTDRLGKRRAIAAGIGLNMLACLALPAASGQLWAALAGLFVIYLSFEFLLTSLIPLMTALTPQARGTFMAANVAAISLGDALGALLGPVLFQRGLAANAGAAAVFNLAAVLILLAFVRPAEEDQGRVGSPD